MKLTPSKEECEELTKAWNNLKRTFITETLLGKIIDKFIISTLNILLKICERIDKIRRTK